MKKKLVPASATAILFAAAASASAQLVYEPFDYGTAGETGTAANYSNTTGTPAFAGYTNPMNGQQWISAFTTQATDDKIFAGGSLSVPGVAAGAGDMAGSDTHNTAKEARLGITPVAVTTGGSSMYYSMMLQVTNVGTLNATPYIAAAFNGSTATATGTVTTNMGTRLELRVDPNDATKYNIGVGTNATNPNIAWKMNGAVPMQFSTTDKVFIVGEYNITIGLGGQDDVQSLWINPTGLGAGTAPAADLAVSGTPTPAAVNGDMTAAGILSFMYRTQSGAGTPSGIRYDELRVDTTWAQAAPPSGSTFTPATSHDWSNAGTWDAGGVPNGSATFAYLNTTGGALHVDSAQTIGTLTIRSGNAYTIDSTGGSLTFNAGTGGTSAINVEPAMNAASGAVLPGSHTISAPLVLANNVAVHAGLNQTVTLSGGVTGTGNILKDDPGTLALAGGANFTGGVFATQGTVALSGTNTFSGPISFIGAGPTGFPLNLLTVDGDASLGGAVPASPSTIDIILSKPTSGMVMRFLSNTTVQAGRTIELTQTGGNGPGIDTNGHNVTIAGIITASGTTNLQKMGSGTLVLTGDVTSTAGGNALNVIQILTGTVNISAANNVPANGGNGFAINAGTNLQFGGSFTWPSAEGVNLNAGGGAIDTNGFSENVSGILSETTTSTFTKIGLGTLTLSNTGNTNANATKVSGGLLEFTAAGTWGTAASTLVANAGGAIGYDVSSIDATFLGKFASATTASVGGLALTSGDSAANLDFTGAAGGGATVLSGANTIGMSIGAIGTVSYTGTITPSNTSHTYRLGGGGTLVVPNTNALTNGASNNSVDIANGGTVVLTSSNNYSGGTTIEGTLTGASGTVANPTTLSVDNTSEIGDGSATNNITFSGGILLTTGAISSAGRSITVNSGGGTISSSGNDSTFGAVSGTGTLTKTDAGTVTVNNVQAGGLAVTGGTVKIATNGTSTGTSVVTTLAAATGRVDLNNNKLVVHNGTLGTFSGGIYSGVTGLAQAGRNGGAWNGTTGLMTSQGQASTGLTTLAVATAGDAKGISGVQTASFGGQTVTASDVLVMYTYGGDANLDGRVNADDYFQIDSNYGKAGSAVSFFKGDFNYDGVVNGDDYAVIDAAFAGQGTPFPAAPSGGLAGVSAVPEPASLGLLMLAGMGLRRRRRTQA